MRLPTGLDSATLLRRGDLREGQSEARTAQVTAAASGDGAGAPFRLVAPHCTAGSCTWHRPGPIGHW
jgi:hypothetical protein